MRCRTPAELPIRSLDAVLIATPPESHRELCTRALASGLGVLVEKPMGNSLEDARAIDAAARGADRPLRVGYARRFRPSYRALRSFLREGAPDAVVETRSRMRFDRARWFGVAGVGSRADDDLLEDAASHQIDLLSWLFGRAVVRVRAEARTGAPGRETIRYALELTGGVIAHCEASHGAGSEEWVVRTAREVAIARAYTMHRYRLRWAELIERGLPRSTAPTSRRRSCSGVPTRARSVSPRSSAASRGCSPPSPTRISPTAKRQSACTPRSTPVAGAPRARKSGSAL